MVDVDFALGLCVDDVCRFQPPLSRSRQPCAMDLSGGHVACWRDIRGRCGILRTADGAEREQWHAHHHDTCRADGNCDRYGRDDAARRKHGGGVEEDRGVMVVGSQGGGDDDAGHHAIGVDGGKVYARQC